VKTKKFSIPFGVEESIQIKLYIQILPQITWSN